MINYSFFNKVWHIFTTWLQHANAVFCILYGKSILEMHDVSKVESIDRFCTDLFFSYVGNIWNRTLDLINNGLAFYCFKMEVNPTRKESCICEI
jgi:hypothetical protein